LLYQKISKNYKFFVPITGPNAYIRKFPIFPDRAISRYKIEPYMDDDIYPVVVSFSGIWNDDHSEHELCYDCQPKTIENGSSEVVLWTNPGSENPVDMFIYPSTDFGYVYCFEVNYFKTKTHEPVEIPKDKVDLWLKISSDW